MNSEDYLLEELNPEQSEAVQHFEGPLLVLSGAGSGKTRVITYRVGYLISHHGVAPDRILGLTFTNKAADEMKERLTEILPHDKPTGRGPWMGTFHSLGANFLREYVEVLDRGYNRYFTIYDQGDQKKAVKETMKGLDISTDEFNPGMIASMINEAKNELIGPEEYRGERSGKVDDYMLQIVDRVYRNYQENLREWNGMDFADLLRLTVKLLELEDPGIQSWKNRFEFLLVDEYQDTNHAQYVLARELARPGDNLCVVGDDDQAIFGWRGADVSNILEFEEDYPDAVVINLSKNYRSRRPILRAANSLISNNRLRKSKEMEPLRDEGESIMVYHAGDETDEAEFLVEEIKHLKGEGVRLGEIAILYRVNPLSRKIEEKLVKRGVPYEIVRGTRFYERKEIKDVLAYLRVITNPDDDLSLSRIFNYPRRGLGAKTEERVRACADSEGVSTWEALTDLENCPELTSRQVSSLEGFVDLIEGYIDRKEDGYDPVQLTRDLVMDIGFFEQLESDYDVSSAEDRKNNVRELVGQIQEADLDEDSLEEFLEDVALESDVDDFEDRGDRVSLLTLHSAKGLEFKYVFIVAFEDGILPHRRSVEENSLEEERRLCYVGLTRAKERVFLSYTDNRFLYGQRFGNLPSRFLKEIPDEELRERSGGGRGYSSLRSSSARKIGAGKKDNWKDFLA
ncbi:UvrD-helicase domain-containing protein [Candidatus Bipolaricaulota bacterium]|nr:UvrD-helicase domain-containing protein [Candidatus Bipolaricaulota bacterium]